MCNRIENSVHNQAFLELGWDLRVTKNVQGVCDVQQKNICMLNIRANPQVD